MPAAEQAFVGFRRSHAAVATTFATHAAVSGGLGPWIPQLKTDNGLDPGGLGIALTGFAVGLVLGTRLAGPAVRGVGGRRVVRLGIPILAGSFALLGAAHGLPSLTAVFAGFGIVSGLLDVAMNNEAVAVERRFARRVMSGMHGMWSLSMFAGTAIASAGVAAQVPIRLYLPLVSVLLVAVSFPMLRWLPAPHDVVGNAEPEPDARLPSPGGGARPTARIILLCMVAGASFLSEGVAADWSALYLRDSVGAAPGTASLGVVAFSACMAVSRFGGDRLAARVDQSVLVRAGTSLAAIALASALLVGGVVPSIAALGLVGLGLGPVVPFAFRAAGAIQLGGGRTGLANTVTAGYVGAIVGPMAVGFIADHVSLRTALLVPVIACLAAAAAAGAAREPQPA